MSPRPFYLTATVLAAAGVGFRLAPASPAPSAAPAPASLSARPAGAPRAAVPTQRYAAIVAANAFSPTRTAPSTRFVPEGLRRDTQVVARRPRKPAEPAIRLFGITRGPGGAVALIDADPAVPGAEIYRLGDRARDGRVAAITDSTVVLTRPSGRVVLRLPAEDGASR